MRELENGVNVNNTNKGNGRVGQVREGGQRIRKETEEFGRWLRGVLVKKDCKMGGVSL